MEKQSVRKVTTPLNTFHMLQYVHKNNHCTQRPRVFCHYLRAARVISCGVSSPRAVLLVFHCCIATVAGGTSQRVFEDHPLSSVLAFGIMIKFIKSVKLVFSGNTNIAYAKKTPLRETLWSFIHKNINLVLQNL